jgi:hypothetical protein
MQIAQHYINGSFIGSNGPLGDSVNPADGARLGQFHPGSAALCDQAAAVAKEVFFGTSWAENPRLRAQVLTLEYLGTTQIVVLKTEFGELKARVDSSIRVNVGDSVGLQFNSNTVTLFDRTSGRAIRSELNEEVLQRG